MSLLKLAAILLFSTAAFAAPPKHRPHDMMLLRTMGDPSPNTIYVFTSATCPHCAVFHREILPDIVQQYVASGRAEIFFVDGASDDLTTTVAMLARCLPPDKAEFFMNAVFDSQAEWMAAKDPKTILFKYAQNQGMSQPQIKECLADDTLKSTIKDQWKNLSYMYRVRGIPTVALRQGNSVRTYSGTNKRYMLNGMANDFIEDDDTGNKKTKRKNK